MTFFHRYILYEIEPFRWVNFQVSWHLWIYTASHQINRNTQCHYCSQTCVQEKYPAAFCQVCAAFDACNSYKPSASAGKYWCFSSFETSVMQCMISVWHKASGNDESILTQTGTTWWHLSPSNKHLWGIVSWISHYVGDHTLARDVFALTYLVQG